MMPLHSASEHRSRLIRNLARPRSNSSRASSRASGEHSDTTGTSLGSQSEDVYQTKPLTDNEDDFSQALPELRASAKKYRPGAARRFEPESILETSDFARAFPDFSSVQPIAEEDSPSIEMGRGLPYNTYDRQEEPFGESVGEFAGFNDLKSRKEGSRVAELQQRLQRHAASYPEVEVFPPPREVSPPVRKATNFGSRQSSAEHPRGLKQAHDRVASEVGTAKPSEARPVSIDFVSKNSRFGSRQSSAAQPLKTSGNSNAGTIIHRLDKASASRKNPNEPTLPESSSSNQPTQQTNNTQTVPNITELISGTFEDGTPVFSRKKSSKSRFRAKVNATHKAVQEMPIPEDEEAIYVSLKILQDRVAELEQRRAEFELEIRELEARNEELEQEKADRRHYRRSDSALGESSGSDSGDGRRHASRKSHVERARQDNTLSWLQEQLKTTEKSFKVSQRTIQNLVEERDAAVSQLRIAYLNSEEIKAENEVLSSENQALKAELAVFKPSMARQRAASGTQKGAMQRKSSTASNRSKQAMVEQDSTQDLTQIIDFDSKQIPQGAFPPAHRGDRTVESKPQDGEEKRSNAIRTRVVVEEYTESEVTDSMAGDFEKNNEMPEGFRLAKFRSGQVGMVGDLTCLSSQSEKFEELRALLEKNRKERKMREAQQPGEALPGNAATSNRIRPAKSSESVRAARPAVSRRSSRNDLAGQEDLRIQPAAEQELEANHTTHSRTSKVSHLRPLGLTDTSLLEQQNERRGVNMEDMTSAFIVPDITIRNPATVTKKKPIPTISPDEGISHNTKNCTICQRVLEYGKPHDHGTKSQIKVPKPVPVSERMPEPDEFNEEPTMRPSESPAKALATVIKTLEDELTHLRMQVKKYEDIYNNHDASMSRRKRKAIHDKIQQLLTVIEAKSDQIYSLYDVVEGQKSSGVELTEEMLNLTLESFVIPPPKVSVRGGFAKDDTRYSADVEKSSPSSEDEMSDSSVHVAPPFKSAMKQPTKSKAEPSKRHSWDLTSDEESLPWEGFTTTADLTNNSRKSLASRHHGSH